jgi:hypothetical protein
MKALFKPIIALFLFSFFVNTTSAQVNQKDFVGIWEFVQFGADPENLGPSAKGVLRISTDTTFTIVRPGPDGFVITQSGTYKVPTTKFYLQKKLYQHPVIGTEGVGQEEKINYWISEDKKAMRFSYAVASGEIYYEVWRKL